VKKLPGKIFQQASHISVAVFLLFRGRGERKINAAKHNKT